VAVRDNRKRIDREWLNHLGRIYGEIKLDSTTNLKSELNRRRYLTIEDLKLMRSNFILDPYDVTTINNHIKDLETRLNVIGERESNK
jgi:hypothetical protein